MVAMRHFFFAVNAYFVRFFSKERIMGAGYANFPPICQLPCAAFVWAFHRKAFTANYGNRYAHQMCQVQV